MTQPRVSSTEVASQVSEQDFADRDLAYLIDERPPWMCQADRYASWYEGVERTIVLLLKRVDIEIDPGRTSEGTHTFHENLLRVLQDPKNFYHEALGYGRVHETLGKAKIFRSMWRTKGSKCRHNFQGYLTWSSGHKGIVEAGLLTAFRILGTRYVPPGTDTMQQIQVHQQQLDERREDLEREKKAFNEGLALRKEAAERCLADQEKTSQEIIARDRATLERERENFNEHVRRTTADLDKRSAEIEEEKSSLQRALQAHRALGGEAENTKLAEVRFDTEKHATAKSIESQAQIEHHMMELQEKLDIEAAELERLQDKVATKTDGPDVSHDDVCAILYRHRRSQNPQTLPTVVGEETEDGSEDLAAMLRNLLTSHARAITKAKIADDRRRNFQQGVEILAAARQSRGT